MQFFFSTKLGKLSRPFGSGKNSDIKVFYSREFEKIEIIFFYI